MKANIAREKLVRVLEENRQAHHETFITALERYRIRLIDEFEQRIQLLHDGKDIDVYVRLPVPEDHTEDYDRVLTLLSMTDDDTIELDDVDVGTYVNDDWGWKKLWLANTASYTQIR